MFVILNAIGCILWGALAAIVVTAGVYFLCRYISIESAHAPLTYVALLVLFILTGAQATMLAGACYAKDYVADMGEQLGLFVQSGSDHAATAAVSVDELRRQLADQFPQAAPWLEQIDLSQASQLAADGGTTVADQLLDGLRSSMNYYILRRALWMIGFVVVALLVALLGARKTYDFYGANDIGPSANSGGGLQF